MTAPKKKAPPASPADKIEEIIVLGGGSAGFLAAITMKRRLPQLKVTVIHSKDIPIIGVGEGTTFTVPIFLHGYLGVDPATFHRMVKPTYKLGIQFLWGPRERFHYSFTNQLDQRVNPLPKANGFYAFEDYDFADMTGALMANGKAFQRQSDGGPLIDTNVAYHIENEEFVGFLERFADEVGVLTMDDTVEEVKQDNHGITSLELKSGTSATADLYLDCSGFRSELIGKAFGEPFESFGSSLFCDRAVAGAWDRSDEHLNPFTTAETMNCGWSWRIEHDHHINRGYVYSSDFISDDEAEQEFREKNPKVGDTRIIKFDTGRYERSWIKNVVGLGNASGFVEPLEATSLAVICDHAAKLVQTLTDSDLTIEPTARRYYNRYTGRNWTAIRRFLAMHYKFNTRIENDFWKACQEETALAGAEEIVEYYQNCGPGLLWALEAMGPSDPFGWEGYLVMLVGQKVPFKKEFQPTDDEVNAWDQYRQNLNTRAEHGLDVAEAVKIIRSDGWGWKPDFYAKAVRW